MVVMGSAGRGESLLRPDQDNGFILGGYPETEHARVDGWFAELARRVTRDLEAAGFPLCAGNVMASNPFWRKTLPQWCAQIDAWTRERSNLAILFADIFFDFRLAYGCAELAAGLRTHVTAVARGNLPFLNQLVWQQTEQPAAFGMFGRLLTGQRAEHPDAIDVKLHGLLPLVELTRLLSLKAGIAETPTLTRLAALRSAGIIDDERHEELSEGYVFLVDLVLRQQILDRAAGRASGYLVAAAMLPRRQREQLLETLRAIEGLRKRVIADMLGSAPVGMAG
jgi:signal-transduction protein with cAMP-binding, CBS, and nucleotidyltransferase domain